LLLCPLCWPKNLYKINFVISPFRDFIIPEK
jgi:hypothetical protein